MWEVVYMEIDEVGYEAAEMEVDKVADMVVKIPNKDDWCDWRLVILLEMMLELVMGDGHGGWQVGWHGGEDT